MCAPALASCRKRKCRLSAVPLCLRTDALRSGGVVLGSKADTLSSLSSPKFGEVTPQILQGRKYLVLRAIGDTDKESGSDAQRRIAAEFYNAIDDWEAA